MRSNHSHHISETSLIHTILGVTVQNLGTVCLSMIDVFGCNETNDNVMYGILLYE